MAVNTQVIRKESSFLMETKMKKGVNKMKEKVERSLKNRKYRSLYRKRKIIRKTFNEK